MSLTTIIRKIDLDKRMYKTKGKIRIFMSQRIRKKFLRKKNSREGYDNVCSRLFTMKIITIEFLLWET